MKKVGLNLTVEGDITYFLGVQINRTNEGKFNLTQPHLISDIIRELRLEDDKVTIKSAPGASSKPLTRCLEEPDFDSYFDYRKVIGKLNYLEKCTGLDISCAVHQAARLVADPKVPHGKAVKWIGRYLKGTADKG
jgi:hypothetical protein